MSTSDGYYYGGSLEHDAKNDEALLARNPALTRPGTGNWNIRERMFQVFRDAPADFYSVPDKYFSGFGCFALGAAREFLARGDALTFRVLSRTFSGAARTRVATVAVSRTVAARFFELATAAARF